MHLWSLSSQNHAVNQSKNYCKHIATFVLSGSKVFNGVASACFNYFWHAQSISISQCLHSVSKVPHCAVAASGFIFLTVQVSIYPNTLVHDVQTRILSFTVWPLISKLYYNKFMILLTTYKCVGDKAVYESGSWWFMFKKHTTTRTSCSQLGEKFSDRDRMSVMDTKKLKHTI